MSEAETRQKIIDDRLKTAGWNLKDPTQVTEEHEVLHQVGTASGTGYCDYVLFSSDGSPLAVVEAKRTSVDARRGRQQAKEYADGFVAAGYKRPFLFYTNGHEIYFWDDDRYAPRKVYGFFYREDLERLRFQKENSRELSTSLIDTNIAGRTYQIEAIRSVLETFERRERKSLLVMATGTGKTRVVIALADLLMRSNWVKRVLFLADRNELLSQASDAFREHLSNAPWKRLSSGDEDLDKRIFLSTYPAMNNLYPKYSPAAFDLVIADESHRSIYNQYSGIFSYFDALQVGLTATPIDFVDRDTFGLFNCDTGVPSFNYPLDRAIEAKFLVNYRVFDVRTRFQVKGIKPGDLTEEAKESLARQGIDPEDFSVEGTDLEKKITNAPTNESLIRDLMQHGLRDATGTRPGKTIIFATSHKHAVRLDETFDRLYPEFRGRLSRVIDSHDPRADSLLREFKNPKSELMVAISVDMLDTGVDVPEVVNLVFAKPVFSRAKFWQMIGRGTRLCPNLFGPGKDKEYFLIFDHWENFRYFDLSPEGYIPSGQTSIPERLFDARLRMAAAALRRKNDTALDRAVRHLRSDISRIHRETVDARDKGAELARVAEEKPWYGFDHSEVERLRNEILPLMRTRSREDFQALLFDLDVAKAQTALIEEEQNEFAAARSQIEKKIRELPGTLDVVKRHEDTTRRALSPGFWNDVTIEKLDELREELRGLMRYRKRDDTGTGLIELDLDDIVMVREQIEFGPENERVSLEEYRRRIEERLKEMLDDNPVLRKIADGSEVADYELRDLEVYLRRLDLEISVEKLRKAYDNRAASFRRLLRRALGFEDLPQRSAIIEKEFAEFIARHNDFSVDQIRFLETLRTYVVQRGAARKRDLVGPPFTHFHRDGVRGLFQPGQIDEIIGLIDQIEGIAA